MSEVLEINSLYLENISLSSRDEEPLLLNIDFECPLDQFILVHSPYPKSSVEFLKFIAGQLAPDSGKILWNGQDVFSNESDLNPQDHISSYFESHNHHFKMTVKDYLHQYIPQEEILNVVDQFDLENYLGNDLSKMNFGQTKLMLLIKSLTRKASLIVWEDPAQGLTEAQWLNVLDYLQFQQRMGYCRHVYMTNFHPTALNHLEYTKLIVDQGILYHEDSPAQKKIAHF